MRIGELHAPKIYSIDFIIYDYTQKLAVRTAHRKVELSIVWAQVALFKLTMDADLTVVAR